MSKLVLREAKRAKEQSFLGESFFAEFIRLYRKLDDAAIVADVRASMDDIEELRADGESLGAKIGPRKGWHPTARTVTLKVRAEAVSEGA